METSALLFLVIYSPALSIHSPLLSQSRFPFFGGGFALRFGGGFEPEYSLGRYESSDIWMPCLAEDPFVVAFNPRWLGRAIGVVCSGVGRGVW